MNAPDFRLENHGSLCLLKARTDAATLWAHENISDEAMHFGGGIVIEPRYVQPIINGIEGDGLTVELA